MIFKRVFASALALSVSATMAFGEVNEIKITKQPGLLFAPTLLMEHHKLIEKHAATAGMKDFKVSWLLLSSGGAAVDGLLSGSVDIVTSGTTNMLLLWGKTNGDVKAIMGVSGLPFKLVTRNPNIKTLKDYGPHDKIALPTVRTSIQAITLGIALQKVYGDDKAYEKLLPNQVQLGHPDALAAILNPLSEITSHFASSPFQEIELKQPNMHTVLESDYALGGRTHITVAFTTSKFYNANPKVVRILYDAYEEAASIIKNDPKAAAEVYLSMTKEKMTLDEVVTLMKQPGAVFQASPVNTMTFATYMYKAGFVKKEPKSWKDYFFPLLHDKPGT